MNIELLLPINTKEKVDKIINLIQLSQEPKSVYTEILVHIQKIKMQLYFKEKFNSIKATLPYKKEVHPLVKDSNLAIVEKQASYKEQYKEALLKELRTGYHFTYKYQNESSIRKQGTKSHKMRNVANNKLVDIRLFKGMTIAQLSNFIDMPLRILVSIIKQKDKSITNLSEDYVLSENNVRPCLDFLQNAYNIKIRKDKEQAELDKKIETAGYYRQKMDDKFKPSLGQEGNYRKLIYIRTKT